VTKQPPRRVAWPALSALLLLAGACAAPKPCGCKAAPPIPPQSVGFDWFEYEGHDPVYQRLRPGVDEYLNPILPGFYPDPSLVRVGGDFYLVTSSFAYFPGVPIFHSQDLVHWQQLGHVLERPSQLDLAGCRISEGIFAPTIRHHQGTFYVVTTRVKNDRTRNFIVTATNPAGPWSDPIWLPEIDGIDPSLFFDDDGRAYVVFNSEPPGPATYEGHRALWLQEYDDKARALLGERRLLVDGGADIGKKPIWIEAPHIFKIRGKYYLIAAEGGTGDQHSEVVFRSDAVTGPYVPYAGNPILTQRHLAPERPAPVTSTGHADFVELPGGDFWAVFLGARPYADDLYNTGRETFLLPVRWQDGWPILLAGEETVPYLHPSPLPKARPADSLLRGGNFTVRDEFVGAKLPPHFSLIRTPRERWYEVAKGWLSIRPRPVDLGHRGQPSFIGRRQQHTHATVSTAMAYAPTRPGDKAGLVAFQNDDFYYFLGVTRADGKSVVEVERHAMAQGKPATSVVASAHLSPSAGRLLFLKIAARGGRYDFYYAYELGKWLPLALDVDGTILSTKIATGFVGTYFGMYAYAARG
jgi:xylan 1,4-beta-xylosidase